MQGIFLSEERHHVQNAGWIALLLTAQTGEKITADMLLLGAEEAQAAQESAAEEEAEALIDRMKRARES